MLIRRPAHHPRFPSGAGDRAGRAGGRAEDGARRHGQAAAAARRPLEQVDGQQQRERSHQHDQSHSGGAGVVILLQLGDDQQRHDLGLHRHIAGDEDDRPVLADGPGEGQREAGEQGRCDGRENHPGEGLPALGAQAGGSFLDLDLEIVEHRLHRADHERQPDEDQGHSDPEPGVRNLDAKRIEIAPDPAVGGIQRGERNARHRGRQGERQVHHGIHNPPAGESVAHQHPGYQEAEDGIDQRGDE